MFRIVQWGMWMHSSRCSRWWLSKCRWRWGRVWVWISQCCKSHALGLLCTTPLMRHTYRPCCLDHTRSAADQGLVTLQVETLQYTWVHHPSPKPLLNSWHQHLLCQPLFTFHLSHWPASSLHLNTLYTSGSSVPFCPYVALMEMSCTTLYMLHQQMGTSLLVLTWLYSLRIWVWQRPLE